VIAPRLAFPLIIYLGRRHAANAQPFRPLSGSEELAHPIGDAQAAKLRDESQDSVKRHLKGKEVQLALNAKPEEPPEQPCPCCGGHMRIIETFQRGQQPKHLTASRPRSRRPAGPAAGSSCCAKAPHRMPQSSLDLRR
jgi:hypothetical protein